ncbi:MAG: hypothetical protein JW797_02990 [Bradymonadales bacterium]|nr:hypothetical protein [Bradymonadales bacterium]
MTRTSRRTALTPWLLATALAMATALSCSGSGGGPAGEPDCFPAEMGDTGEDPISPLGVVHVWSQDGSQVGALFTAAVDPCSGAAASNYRLVASDDSLAEVERATVNGQVVLLDLSGDMALDPALTWELQVEGVVGADGTPLDVEQNSGQVMGTVYLNLIWHQHQPSYLNPTLDELQGPWVRKHATKDYYDMTAILLEYPDIHLNVNLTSSLLQQLDLYIERLGPFVSFNEEAGIWQVDEAGFLAEWEGKTDPWIDLLLTDTPDPAEATEEQIQRYWDNIWSTRSIAEPLRSFFPDYEALLEMDGEDYTQLDLLYLKLYFEIAWMDPDFLTGPVVVYQDDQQQDVVVDLSDVVVRDDDGFFFLDPDYTTGAADDDERLARGEALANRLVAENYKIMAGVFAIHRQLLYHQGEGQVDVLTTPFFHPILPLLHNTELAAEGQPNDPLPSPAFSYPEDVFTQIGLATQYYARKFGQAPRGMWPSEGAVAEEVIPAFVANDIEWIATDRQVLDRGIPGASHLLPYRIDADTEEGDGGENDDEMMIVFRDTSLADKVSFHFQGNPAQQNADEFVADVLSFAGPYGTPSQVLTMVADGENAWEWFTQDHDAKGFFHALYTNLEEAFDLEMIITVTGSEYIDGNAGRGIPPHPITEMTEYEDLFPGSWIYGTLSTWIGEMEENLGWNYLRTAREALAAAEETIGSEIELDSLLDPPEESEVAEYAWFKAWQSMLAAEGSDWFWWYGTDQTAAGGDDGPFDEIYRSQLLAMYTFMNTALEQSGNDPVEIPTFPPVLQEPPVELSAPFVSPPTIDGQFLPDDSEWTPPAGVFYDNDSAGVEIDPDDDIRRVLYGYLLIGVEPAIRTNVYIGIEFNEDVSAHLGTAYAVSIYTSHQNLVEGESGPEITGDPFNIETEEGVPADFFAGGVARQVKIDLSSGSAVATLAEADGSGGWEAVASHNIRVGGPIAGGTVLELVIPMRDLGMDTGDPMEFLVVASQDGEVVDYAPNIGSHVVFADPTKMVTVIFELDVTGSQIPIDTYIAIANPPPPDGTGQASIVGNQDVLANWTPCSVFMSDDGVEPDVTAEDNIWTRSFLFSPGLLLQYKYNIGTPEDEGSWSGTEEFPLTNRGYRVPTDGTRRIRIRDIFADRPDPSGNMGPNAAVTVEE